MTALQAGQAVDDWVGMHPAEFTEINKKLEGGEVFFCSSQWRRCEDEAVHQWVHENDDGKRRHFLLWRP